MYKTYSFAFKEQALVKVYSRGERTIESVADELNLKVATLKIWMKRKMKLDRSEQIVEQKEKRPQDWRVEEQLLALQESFGLTGEALSAWCREKGLFPHHLTAWRNAFCGEQKTGVEARENKSGIRELKDENDQLKRELRRKEKALAEAAALLVLQKKFRALWEDEEK